MKFADLIKLFLILFVVIVLALFISYITWWSKDSALVEKITYLAKLP
jgi:hypothetical protein